MTSESPERSSTSASPLGEHDLRALRDARAGARKIRRAASVAALNGWTLALFALLTLLGVFFSLSAIPIALALGVVAHFEIQGGRMLRRLDPRACTILHRNEVALAALILVYASWMLIGALAAPAPRPDAMSNALSQLNSETALLVRDITRTVTIAMYGTLAVVGPIGPLLLAWYYASRRKLIDALRAESPEWTIEVLGEAA